MSGHYVDPQPGLGFSRWRRRLDPDHLSRYGPGTRDQELEQESVPVAEADAFRLFDVHPASSSAPAIEGFTNGLTLMAVTPTQSGCVLHWWVESPPLGIFPRLLISNPPPPGVDTLAASLRLCPST